MPLPPALQARLLKRGILRDSPAESGGNSNDQRSETQKSNQIEPDWREVPDEESGYYYWWNIDTGQVSWLPPNDSECVITMPASHHPITVPVEDSSAGPEPSVVRLDLRQHSRIKLVPYGKKDKGKRRSERSELDPMDPSAYSDAPRGTWSSGLKPEGEAKTGVDTTANGPLFQMRPYPNPGAILKMNAETDKTSIGPTKN